MNSERANGPKKSRELWLAVALLLIAFALRVAAIDAVPPGLMHDEIAQLGVSDKIRAGDWRLFYPDNYGVEPLYHYALAASLSTWGLNSMAMRLPEVFAGMVGLAGTYVLAARLFNRRVGLIALAAAGVTWWSIIVGRAVLREGWQIPLYALALYAFWRGFEPAQSTGGSRVAWRPFALSGLALGVGAYVYTVSRGLVGVFIVFGVYLLIFHRALFKRLWRGLVIAIGLALIMVASLQIYTAAHPEFEDIAPVTLLQEGVGSMFTQLPGVTARVISHYFWLGEANSELNLPYRPMFNPAGTLLFALGLLLALWRFRKPAYMLVLLAWGIVLVPMILFDAHFPFTRLSAAQPLAFTLIGFGGDALITLAQKIRSGRAVLIGLATAGSLILAFSLIDTVQAMFVNWPAAAATQSVYNAELRQVSRWAQAQSSPITQCTLWIEFPWDPQYHQSIAHEAGQYFGYPYDRSRWHDCRYSLVIPAGGQFIFAHSDLAPLDNFLGRDLKKPWLEKAQPLGGLPGALSVDARSTLLAKQAEWNQLPVKWPPETSITAPAQLPIDFNRAVELIGYQVEPSSVKPGESVRVITAWRVTGEVPQDLIAFTHLYRTPSEVLAQQDRLDVDGPSLQAGDVFIQAHEFITVPPETPPGNYWIAEGLYRQDTGERWPIFAGDQRAADRLYLTQVQVTP
jgi:4-amino-4-deoxy-L-arabinose transferase-like glycosyltransferase